VGQETLVWTVEHLLGALSGLGLENARVQIEGCELPALDGSAVLYARSLWEAGRCFLPAPARWLSLAEPLYVEEGASWVLLEPAERLSVEIEIDFPHPLLGRQRFSFLWEPYTFLTEVAPARTFILEEEVEGVRALGLGRGGTLENTVVFARDGGVVQRGGLRFCDEAVRHKVLDALGDLALLGAPLRARYRAFAPGHTLHRRLVQYLGEAFVQEREAPCFSPTLPEG